MITTPYKGPSPDPHNERLIDDTGYGLSNGETYTYYSYVSNTPHLEAEYGKFVTMFANGTTYIHADTHSSFQELGVAPHLNYILGKAAVTYRRRIYIRRIIWIILSTRCSVEMISQVESK